MTPYYRDELVTLYHGDCREITAWLDADVLVTDPPYGMSWQSGQRKDRKLDRIQGDRDTSVRDAVLDLWGDRPGLVFGHWSVSAPRRERQRLIWSKGNNPGMGDLRMPWGPSFEDIHVIGDARDWGRTAGKRTGSVITTHTARGGVHGDENATGHPTPKPVALMELLLSRCPPGVVADPFAGSGATLLACRNLGRKCVGVEIEEKYCEVVVKRLGQQAFIFDGAS